MSEYFIGEGQFAGRVFRKTGRRGCGTNWPEGTFFTDIEEVKKIEVGQYYRNGNYIVEITCEKMNGLSFDCVYIGDPLKCDCIFMYDHLEDGWERVFLCPSCGEFCTNVINHCPPKPVLGNGYVFAESKPRLPVFGETWAWVRPSGEVVYNTESEGSCRVDPTIYGGRRWIVKQRQEILPGQVWVMQTCHAGLRVITFVNGDIVYYKCLDHTVDHVSETNKSHIYNNWKMLQRPTLPTDYSLVNQLPAYVEHGNSWIDIFTHRVHHNYVGDIPRFFGWIIQKQLKISDLKYGDRFQTTKNGKIYTLVNAQEPFIQAAKGKWAVMYNNIITTFSNDINVTKV